MSSAKRNLASAFAAADEESTSKKLKNNNEGEKAIEELNSIQVKKFSKLKDLTIGEEIRISSARRLSTKYGEQILIELDENIVFLPKRYASMSETTLKALNEGMYMMKLVEVVGKTFNIHFRAIDQNEDSDATDVDDVFLNNNELGYFREMNIFQK